MEDKLAIYNLIATHPLTADTGNASLFEHVYTEDASFDRGPNLHGAAGRDNLVKFAGSDAHELAMSGGLAHFGNLPFIVHLGANEADVVSYIMIVTARHNDQEMALANHGASKGHDIFRVVANRWKLVRESTGWRIKSRTLFPMDGQMYARDLLNGAIQRHLDDKS